MRPEGLLLAAVAALLSCAAAHATEVAVCTDHGRFVIDLADSEAPKQVENFLRYVDTEFYTGTVIHRVMPGFVVQGGGYDRKLGRRPTSPPVANESGNGLRNERGTVAAARGEGADTATSQFFVNLADDPELDRPPGYTVFGRVKDGLDVVDSIGRLPTGAMGPLKDSVPMPLVVIQSVGRLDERALAEIPEAGREAALKEHIHVATAAQDYAAARRWIDLYRASCGAADPNVAIDEARAALGVGDQPRARFVLEEYFATNQQSDPTYEDAVALYRSAVPEQAAAQTGDAGPSGSQAIGDCKAPATPEIPDGSSASTEQMVAVQSSVKAYVVDGQAYIKCVDAVADDKDRATTDRNAAIGEHNRMVGELERAAADFNDQLRAFKTRY
jgi:cyclophilin family peptidyl-prolyl cis-trans isomerase